MKTIFSLLFLFSINLNAAIKTEVVEYKQGDTTLEGYMAFDDTKVSPRPAVLVVHDWLGIRQQTKDKVEQLAKLGYVAFAADIYGKGVRPQNAEEAGKLAAQYKGDRKLLRARAKAAYDQLVNLKHVHSRKIVAIGYCFGGTTALELARSGAFLAGTVSFHGGLSTPNTDDAKNIKGKVLTLHGADDPFVKADEVAAFKEEMKKAKIDMTFVAYPGAVHSFTIPDAGNDNSKGTAYNAKADKESWTEFQKFLKRVL